MKIILAAVALTIATPALAQTSAPADSHANHAPAEPMGQAGHAGGAGSEHEGHDMQSECSCCAKMKADGKEMECCDKAAGEAGDADPHAGHNMND
jgi:hypothetical protein